MLELVRRLRRDGHAAHDVFQWRGFSRRSVMRMLLDRATPRLPAFAEEVLAEVLKMPEMAQACVDS